MKKIAERVTEILFDDLYLARSTEFLLVGYIVLITVGIFMGWVQLYNWAFDIIGFDATCKNVISLLLTEGITFTQMLSHCWIGIIAVIVINVVPTAFALARKISLIRECC